MPRGRGKFKAWEARTRVFLVLMGRNSKRGGKREWHQKSVARELKEESHDISATSAYRHLKKLEDIGLAVSKEVEPERGIKMKKVYSVNLDPSRGKTLGSKDRGVLETFFDKFGDDFKEKGIKGLNYDLLRAIPDAVVLNIVIRESIFPPLDAARYCGGEAGDDYEEFISTGSIGFMPSEFRRLGLKPYQTGIGQYRDEVKRYIEELSDEDIEFLNTHQEIVHRLLEGWMKRLSEVSVVFPS